VSSSSDLAALVSATDPRKLLPTRLSEENAQLPARVELHDAFALGESLLLLLVGSGDARYVAPVVTTGTSLKRARPGDGAATALIDVLRAGGAVDAPAFLVQVFGDVAVVTGERPMLVDQTHESVVVADSAVVKWMVKVEPTPAPTLVAHLQAVGFTQMPRPWGFVSWGIDEPVVLAAVTDLLPDASDGWSWCVADVGSYGRGDLAQDEALKPIATLGRLIGQLHLALATPSEYFAEPRHVVGGDEITAWSRQAHGLLAEALDLVAGDEGKRLRERAGQIAAAIDEASQALSTPTIPVHGDLHVGQILRWQGGYAVNDFDGNPVLPVAERLRPQPAARDVAGMVQSLDHVGRVVIRRVDGVDADLVHEWIVAAQHAFISSYKWSLADAGMSDLLDERLLLPFRVEQECREYLYAEKHLPRWRYVPDAAIQALFPSPA